MLVGGRELIMGIRAKKEVQRMSLEVFAEEAALEIWEHLAEPCRARLRVAGRAGEMLDEHGASKSVFAGT